MTSYDTSETRFSTTSLCGQFFRDPLTCAVMEQSVIPIFIHSKAETDRSEFLIWSATFRQADDGTSRECGGTGLGLTIAKEYAQLLSGGITAASTLGEGSVP